MLEIAPREIHAAEFKQARALFASLPPAQVDGGGRAGQLQRRRIFGRRIQGKHVGRPRR